MSKEYLKTLFGIDDIEKIVGEKSASVVRARPVKPKVKRIQMTPDECRDLCKTINLEYMDGFEQRVLEYVITDETVDRYGDVVKASGGDFTNYRKNPTVLAFHNGRAFPVGNALKTWHEEDASHVKQWVLFFDDRIDRTGMADTAFRFASSGAMKTGSIGFIPKENGTRRPVEEERKKMRMPAHGVIYESWELLEFSVTPVPANPNASQKEYDEVIRRGLYCNDTIQAARGIFSDEEIAAACDLVKDSEIIVENTESPQVDKIQEQITITIDNAIKEIICKLNEKIELLIQKIDLMATVTERNIETLKLAVSPRPEKAADDTVSDEPVDFYDEESVAAMIDNVTSNLRK